MKPQPKIRPRPEGPATNYIDMLVDHFGYKTGSPVQCEVVQGGPNASYRIVGQASGKLGIGMHWKEIALLTEKPLSDVSAKIGFSKRTHISLKVEGLPAAAIEAPGRQKDHNLPHNDIFATLMQQIGETLENN